MMDAQTANIMRTWLSGSIRRIESEMAPTPRRNEMLRNLNAELDALPTSNVIQFPQRRAA